MTIYQWLCILGLPSLFSLFVICVKQLAALKLGLQAVLRNQMIQDYNRYSEKGYAPIYAKESFESCYEQYHTLGANGVMDKLHDDFLKLPNRPQDI